MIRVHFWVHDFVTCSHNMKDTGSVCLHLTIGQGVANRGASIRVGRDTEKEGKGYFEDRRPASNMDPYVVTSMIAETTLLWKPWVPSYTHLHLGKHCYWLSLGWERNCVSVWSFHLLYFKMRFALLYCVICSIVYLVAGEFNSSLLLDSVSF